MIGGWPLSVAAAALAAVATLSRQALVLNSVEAARPRCTCYGPGSILGAGRVLDTLSMASPCFSAAPGRGWICWKCASDNCLRAGGEPCSRPERIPVGRCLETFSRSWTPSSSHPGVLLPHPRLGQYRKRSRADPACCQTSSHFQVSGGARATLRAASRAARRTALRAALRAATRAVTRAAVRAAVRAALRAATRATLQAALRAALRAAVRARLASVALEGRRISGGSVTPRTQFSSR